MEEKKYEKLTQHEHILKRPGMYIGSVEPSFVEGFVLYENNKIKKEDLTFSFGLYKIFDEALQNAIDQSVSDKKLKNIKVSINENNGEISIYNDGTGIPVAIHEKEKIYIPELIFGHLLTSSNYDDSVKRIVGGTNGLGIKVCSVFSSKFMVEVSDGKKVFVQQYSDNMFNKQAPKITKATSKQGYVKITFTPDFLKFKMKSIKETDILKVLYSRVRLASMVLSKKISLFLNDEEIQDDIKTISKKINEEYIYESSEDGTWEVSLMYNPDNNLYGELSFVNGIHTFLNGKHVDYIFSQLYKKINDLSKIKISIKELKDRLFIILKATVQNPAFNSQSKEALTTTSKDFGYTFDLSTNFVKKIMKSGIIEDIKTIQIAKEESKLKKTDGKKSSRIRVNKLEDANYAGTSKSSKCALILTEGDSAKTFAISGLSVIGRDYFGVYPLKGKALNTREATKKQLLENEELNNLKKIIGLQQGKEYNNVDSLRYGKIIILTDQDNDGMHIRSLVVNIFATLWPSLLKINGFLSTMNTPLIKATKRGVVKQFYTMSDYNDWKNEVNPKSWTIKYYKGLGTSTALEAKDYFKDIKNLQVDYYYTKNSEDNIGLAFDKKRADERKQWILDYIPKEMDRSTSISYDSLINEQLVQFSIYDVQRSIPNINDGLKPSQRKIIYTALKNNIVKEYKVAQFAGEIAKESAYHHGEASLMGAIIGMAQNYMGSNNINLLTPAGQFGTRLVSSGKDAASPRYIFTKLEDITLKIFNSNDFPLLKYNDDDGVQIEPEYYSTIIPMILVNGASGIGTGFSTNIPSYNPKDIIHNIRNIINKKPVIEMTPYFKNFKGVVEKVSDTKYITNGVSKKVADKLIITELPVGRATEDYLEYLNDIAEKGIIKDYKNFSTEEDINIEIYLMNGQSLPDLKLTSNINISNMYLFDSENRIKKYDTINDILSEYYKTRLMFYKKRKEYITKKLKEEIKYLSNKMRFLQLILENKLKIFRVPKKTLDEKLEELEFDRLEASYNYLTEMPISSFTEEKLEDLDNKRKVKNEELKYIENKTPKDLWCIDLDDLEKYL